MRTLANVVCRRRRRRRGCRCRSSSLVVVEAGMEITFIIIIARLGAWSVLWCGLRVLFACRALCRSAIN